MLGYQTITQPPYKIGSKLDKCWIHFQPPQNLPNTSLRVKVMLYMANQDPKLCLLDCPPRGSPQRGTS